MSRDSNLVTSTAFLFPNLRTLVTGPAFLFPNPRAYAVALAGPGLQSCFLSLLSDGKSGMGATKLA